MAEKLLSEKKIGPSRQAADPDQPRFKLFLSVTQAISEADTYQEAIEATLREVCEATGWDIGEAWFPTPGGKALRCGPGCYSRTRTLENFKVLCEGMTFPPGIGLAGRVWVSKQPEWIQDMSLAPDDTYPRAKIARELGLKAALAVPIIANDEVLAVLGFFMQEPREESKQMVQDVSAVATQLGWVIQHKRAEEALRESERRFRAIFDQTFEFVGLLSLDGTLLEANQTALDFLGLKRSDVVGRPFWEIPCWERSPQVHERLKAAIRDAAQGKFVRYEVDHLDRHGAKGRFDFSLKPVTDERGKVVLIIPEGRNITELKRAERELRESEERYRQLVELSPDAIFLNHEGKFYFVNGATLELFRARSPDQLIGRPVTDVIHPDYRALVNERVRQILEYGIKTPLVEQRNIRLDGTEVDIEVTASPLTYQGKRMVQVVARDITERKRAEQALRESEARLQAIMDSSTAVIFLKDVEGRYMLVNHEYERLFHVTREEIKGKTDYDIFPREMAEAFRANDLKVLELGTPMEFEETAPHDGAMHTYIANKFPLYDSAGVPYAVCGIATDITERKVAEERVVDERRRAETWLQSLIDTTQDAVISIDRQGRVMLFNPAAERMFGYTRGEVEGQNISLLMGDPFASEHKNYLARYEQTGERRAIGGIRTVVARRKNGEVFPIELSVTEVTTPGEVRYAAFIRDVSEKTRLQEQLIESERLAAIGTTAAKLAHEVGNPLNGMYMTAQLLERRLARRSDSLDDTAKSSLQSLKDEITRLNQLLVEFRSLSRREKYSFRPTAIATVAAEVLDMELPRYQALRIRVEQEFPASLPLVCVDGEKLKQAVLNLCKNAAEAMPHGGTLTLRAYNSGEHMFLEVADTGLGVPSDVDIFEPFATTKSWGTGLGLVIVRQIVTAHGGTVTYTSERGRGTVFRLTLPLNPPAQESA